MDPFKQPDDVSIWYYVGRLIVCVMLGVIISIAFIVVPMWYRGAKTNDEMMYGVYLMVMFTTFCGVVWFIQLKR